MSIADNSVRIQAERFADNTEALNTKERQEQLVKTGEKLVAKKKYASKRALANAMGGCDIRSVSFRAVWIMHERSYGPKIPTPKAIGADAVNYASVETDDEEVDRLIDEQSKDKISESFHRKGRESGNRSKV